MTRKPNRHGLTDYIPSPVRRKVRQRCGFGCVICGNALIHYHHFDPPFPEAHEHEPEGITLLCDNHHRRATSGALTDQTIRKHNAEPCCRKAGYTKDAFYIGDGPILVRLGSAEMRANRVVVYEDEHKSEVLLGFSKPEKPGGPFRLNARLYDQEESELLEIVNNEWRAGIDHYDIETKGNRIIIRKKRGQILLVLSSESERQLYIERLIFGYKGNRLVIGPDRFEAVSPNGSRIVHQGMIFAEDGIILGPSELTYGRSGLRRNGSPLPIPGGDD